MGEDLDVLIELCDRILVICAGKVTGVVDGRRAIKEQIGLLMTKTSGDVDENQMSIDELHDEQNIDNDEGGEAL